MKTYHAHVEDNVSGVLFHENVEAENLVAAIAKVLDLLADKAVNELDDFHIEAV